MRKVNVKTLNEELFYTQVMTKPKLKVSRFLLKKLEDDYRVKELFNTDLLHAQQYLFTKLRTFYIDRLPLQVFGLTTIRS